MKKVLLALGVVAMLFASTSCNKEKTCVCSYTINVLGVESTIPLGEKVIDHGTCRDLENAGAWNLSVGTIGDATFHCERK